MQKEKSQVIALRVPKETYAIILERSKEWEMSVSVLLRELIVKVFNDQESNTIKAYKKRRENSNGNCIETGH